MKFSPIVLFLLLVFDGLKGLTLPQERPDKGLNTTLQANFSGVYVKRNPCNNEQMEASSYEASHEFHHHAKGSNWSEYTQKCSVLISNFLKSISNLINFNNKHDSTFTFHVNTSISQKQADQRNCKDQKYSMPTIIIEATNCVNSEQSKVPKDKGLTEEGLKQEVVNGLHGKQKSRWNPEKAHGDLTTISQERSGSFSTLEGETEADLSFTDVSDGPVTIFEKTQITEIYPLKKKNANNLEARQECEDASKEIPNKYFTEQPYASTVNSEGAVMSQTDSVEGQIFDSTEKVELNPSNAFRNSNFKIVNGPFETVTNRELSSPDSQPQLSFNGARTEESDFISPASSMTQQPTNPLYSRASQLPQNDDPHFFLTTIAPTNTAERIETIEDIVEYDGEQSDSQNAGNIQTTSFNSNINSNVQPAESLDYLEKQAELSNPKILVSATSLPEFLPTVDRFEPEKVTTALPPKRKLPQMRKKSDSSPNTFLTSEASPETSSIGLGPQTHLDATQPQPKNLFGQGGYPASEKINQASPYSQLETHVSSSEDLAELYRDDQYYTTFPPNSEDQRYGGPNTGTSSAFLAEEFSDRKTDTVAGAFRSTSQKPLTPKINKKAGKVFNTQPGQNPASTLEISNSHQKTTPLMPAESLIMSSQKRQLGTPMRGFFPSTTGQYEEEIMDQFQSSEQSKQTYIRDSETTLDNNQNFSEAPVYRELESSPPRKYLRPETVLKEGSTQPLDFGTTTRRPVPIDLKEKTNENLNFKSERLAAGQITNFNEQPKSFKSSENRPPVLKSSIDPVPVTYGPRRNVVTSLGDEEIVTAESSLRQASEVKPNFFPSRISDYDSPTPPTESPFVSESSLTSDSVKYDFSDSLSTASSSLSVPTVSEPKNRIISQEPPVDNYDTLVEQSPGDMNNPDSPLNEPSEDSLTTPYSESMPQMTSSVYESDSKAYSQENLQLDAPSTSIYEPQITSAPQSVELNIPVEKFQSNAERLLPSDNYESSALRNTFPNYGTTSGKNFDSYPANNPTTVPVEFMSETESDTVSLEPAKFSENQLPVGALTSAFSRQNQFSEGVVKSTEGIHSSDESEAFSLKPVDYQTPTFDPKFQISTNIPDRNQFPVITQSQSGTSKQFSETTLDSSDTYLQQTSITVPVSASQKVAANSANNDQKNSLLTKESYDLNQNNADISSEQRQYDDIVSSQDARTQIPQPQPSLDYSDYSGQLSSIEGESNTASTDLQTSKTFEGSEPNFQPLLTYSPSPSSKTQTFTSETYESDLMASEHSLPSQFQPKPVGSGALERADTSSPFLGQLSSDRNIKNIDTTELSQDHTTPMYDNQFIPITPPPSLTAVEEPPLIKTDLSALETYSTPEIFVEDISTTPRPQSVSSVRYDQEIVTIDGQPTPSPSPVALLPVHYSGQSLNKKKEQGFVGRNVAVTQQLEDRLERSDIKAAASELVLENSNRGLRDERVMQKSVSNQDIKALNTALIGKKYDSSPRQLPAQSVTLPQLNKGTSNLPKTETYSNSFDLTSSAVAPVHTKTTFDEEIITTDSSNSLSLPPTQAPSMGYSQSFSDEHFRRQGLNSPSSTTPQPPRQFYPENRPIHHPSQGFPSQQNFENRPYGNYPQSLNFNPQAPRPGLSHFDNWARDQRNQFPTGFQQNRFQSSFPPSNRFQPGLDSQQDRFMFPGQPSNYGNRYLPNGEPNFPYVPPSRPGMNSEPLSSPSQVPNFFSFQQSNGFQQRDSQYQSYQGEGRLGERNYNTQLIAPPYAQNYEPHPYYPRDDFRERFGPNYQSFGPESRDGFRPDQVPYNQMMPPYRNHQAGYFNPQAPLFLNNSSQQVDDRYQQYTFDRRMDSERGAKTEETEKIGINQASPEVLADYKKALTELPSGERLVKFDEEVITISPEKGPSSEATVDAEKHEQRHGAASYNFRNQDRQKTESLMKFNKTTAFGQMPDKSMEIPPQQAQQENFAFRAQNNNLDYSRRSPSHSQSHPPFSQSVDSFGPQQPTSLPNFSNQFRSALSDFQQQSNANFVNPQKPNVGNEVGSNPSQSDSYALGPDQISPSRKPGENYVSFYGHSSEKSAVCPCDLILKGNMTAPSYFILVSKLPAGAGGEEIFKVEKVYLGDGTPLKSTFYEGKTFPTSLYAPVPFSAVGTVQLPTKNP